MEMISEIVEKELNSFDGHVGIGFKNIQSGEEYFYNGDKRFIAASTFKVPVLVEFYNQVVHGKLNPDERHVVKEEDVTFGSGVLKELKPGLALTLKDYVTLMMIISDNVATDIIINILGKENINNTISSLGLKNTRVTMTCKELLNDAIGIKPTDNQQTISEKVEKLEFDENAKCFTDLEDNNITSPSDMVGLFNMIYHKQIVNNKACEEMIGIMKRCQMNWRIPRYFPKNVKVAHKTGAIAGIANDAGIVFTEKADYILAVYTNGPEDKYDINIKGFDFIARLSKKIYDNVAAGLNLDY